MSDVLPAFRPISELLTKDVGKFMSGIWNGYVDEYIALATDGRHKLEIEQAAKLDLCYGPLWKRCEASGCVAVEGPALKMKCCAGCRKVRKLAARRVICLPTLRYRCIIAVPRVKGRSGGRINPPAKAEIIGCSRCGPKTFMPPLSTRFSTRYQK